MATLSNNEIRYTTSGRDIQPHTKGQVTYLCLDLPKTMVLHMETSLSGSYQLPLFAYMQHLPDNRQSLTMNCTMTCMSYEAGQLYIKEEKATERRRKHTTGSVPSEVLPDGAPLSY